MFFNNSIFERSGTLKVFLYFLILLCSAFHVSASSSNSPAENLLCIDNINKNDKSQSYLLNSNWRYLEKHISLEELDKVNENEWKPVTLPHTWNRFDATDNEPGYRRSSSWYKQKINIPDVTKSFRYLLYFEGVNMTSKVYVNGQYAGGHVGGYVGFKVDITPFIQKGESNEILVQADNSVNRNIIPSQKSDFFIYGGIFRDVWLLYKPPVYINSVQIQTPGVSAESAQTQINLELKNDLKTAEKVTLNIDVFDPDDNSIIHKTIEHELENGDKIKVVLPEIKSPQLWSPDAPNLYTIDIKLNSESGTDIARERVGYRWFRFEEHGPFYLNGERLLLRGTHRHEEYAGYGSAMPDSLHRKDMEMIKEMGANFVRLAHYPQDPEIYRACDELGLLVWDELPWCRGGMGKQKWQANTKRLFKEQILQNYNHPSIILWSLGNEMYWLPDFENGDNKDSLNFFVTQLNDMAHKLDPYRLTTMRKYYDGADITDVFSPSIWAGWYSGVYKTYKQALEKSRKKYPRFMHAEYGGSSHVGRHSNNPITGEGLVKENVWTESPNMIDVKKVSSTGNWDENYMVDLFDWHLMVTEQLDWFTGNAQWAFKDFGTPLRPENPIPFVNQKGLVDCAGNPKDAWYVFRAYWSKQPRFTYIESHTWTDRFGKSGDIQQVCVYSNCDKVGLQLNGELKEIKTRDISNYPATGFHWNVTFQDGANELIAIGYVKGKEITRDTLSVNYHTSRPGKPEKLVLNAEELKNGNFLVHAKVVDKNDLLCYEFEDRVYFDKSGPGKILQNYGTPTRSSVIEFANGKAAIECIPPKIGEMIIEARTQDFKGSYLTIKGTRQ